MGRHRKLNKQQEQRIVDLYASDKARKDIEKELSEEFDVSERTIRTYANDLKLTSNSANIPNDKVMVYDIEK